MLPDDNAVPRSCAAPMDLQSRLQARRIHLSMSTIGTATAEFLARKHALRDQGYVSAPVFGQSGGCQSRQLFVIAAGRSADLNRCQRFQLSWPATFVVGRRPGAPQISSKLLGNMMTAPTLERLAETAAVLSNAAWTRSISSTS